MRTRRIKNEIEGYYHIVSRCVLRQFLFDNRDKETMVRMMRRIEAFSGVRVLAYCFMSNHFHILVHVKKEHDLPEEILLERVKILRGEDYALILKARWEFLRKSRKLKDLQKEQDALRARMGDVSEFMKTLKQYYTTWYCYQHKCDGTIWQGRFKSTFVEGSVKDLSTIAAYIDLNPVRAGIVEDPKDYKFSSYGSAMRGDAASMESLAWIYKRDDVSAKDFIDTYAAVYRVKLYLDGADSFDVEAVSETIAKGGKLPIAVMLRCKVRYFTSGAVIGSKDFVNSCLKEFDFAFGEKRKTKAARMRYSSEGLYSARRLRCNTIALAQQSCANASNN